MTVSLPLLISEAWSYTSSSMRSGALPGIAFIASSSLSHLIARYAFYPDLETIRPSLSKFSFNESINRGLISSCVRGSCLKASQFFLNFSLSLLPISSKCASLASFALPILGIFCLQLKFLTSGKMLEKSTHPAYWAYRDLILLPLISAYQLRYGLPASLNLSVLSIITVFAQNKFIP